MPCMRIGFTLDALAQLRKATLSFVLSARLTVRMEQFGSHRTDFHEIWHLSIFSEKTVEKSQVSLKSAKNTSLQGDQCTFLIISHSVLLRMRDVSDRSCSGKQNTRFVLSNPPPPPPFKSLVTVTTELSWPTSYFMYGDTCSGHS
jgi:hypothetical protein